MSSHSRIRTAIIIAVLVFALVYVIGLPDKVTLDDSQLLLLASVSSTTIESGNGTTLHIEMMNTGTTIDTRGGSAWPSAVHRNFGFIGFPSVPCTLLRPLFGFLMFNGSINAATLAGANPLNVTKPETVIYNCPEISTFSLLSYYSIYGFSDVAYGIGGPTGIVHLSFNMTLKGYWVPEPPYTGNPFNQTYAFMYFQEGSYTLAVVDGFGSVIFLHFYVT